MEKEIQCTSKSCNLVNASMPLLHRTARGWYLLPNTKESFIAFVNWRKGDGVCIAQALVLGPGKEFELEWSTVFAFLFLW